MFLELFRDFTDINSHMADNEELQKEVQDAHEQIRTLKQAVIRLQRQLTAVHKIANRAQEQSRRSAEDLRGVKRNVGSLQEKLRSRR